MPCQVCNLLPFSGQPPHLANLLWLQTVHVLCQLCLPPLWQLPAVRRKMQMFQIFPFLNTEESFYADFHTPCSQQRLQMLYVQVIVTPANGDTR